MSKSHIRYDSSLFENKLFLCFLTGVDYTIDGYLQCGKEKATLSEIKKLHGKYSILM
jgi:hypothetical protein